MLIINCQYMAIIFLQSSFCGLHCGQCIISTWKIALQWSIKNNNNITSSETRITWLTALFSIVQFLCQKKNQKLINKEIPHIDRETIFAMTSEKCREDLISAGDILSPVNDWLTRFLRSFEKLCWQLSTIFSDQYQLYWNQNIATFIT